MTNLF